MTLDQMVLSVRKIIRDAAILEAEIISELNAAQMQIAFEANFPKLLRSGKVTARTGEPSTAMPDDFHHDLVSCWNLTAQRWVDIRTNTKSLYKDFTIGDLSPLTAFPYTFEFTMEDATGSERGSVTECAIELGMQMLYVRKIPNEDEILTVQYYAKPTVMTAGTDIPDAIPEELHKPLIVSTAAVELLPDTDMDPANIRELVMLHSSRAANARARFLAASKFASSMTPVKRRLVREY